MAWVDGMSMPVGATNEEQVYAFIDYAYRQEPAGVAIDSHGYNSPVLGADTYSGDTYKKNFCRSLSG